MTRSRVWLTLSLAVLVGALIGLTVFRLAGPLPLATAQPSVPASTAPAPSPASPTPTPSASPTPTPSPTPKATKSAKPARTTAPPPKAPTAPTPSVSTPPPFTNAALLQPAEFRESGWGDASVIQTWNDLPSEQVTDCTEVTADDGSIKAAFAAKYQGLSTTAGETVVRFESAAAARLVVQNMVERIGVCEPAGGEFAGLAAERMEAPAPDGISELYLWNTTGSPTVEGAVGLARAEDRIALVSLESETTDPVQTTQVGALMLAAGRRLR